MRINVTLSDRSYRELKQAADDADMDMSEFVRLSIRYFKYLHDQKKGGKKIYLGTEQGVSIEVLWP